jgi:hypothetical protein
MDTDVYYNGIAVSNLVDGGVFFGFAVSENVTFTSTTHIHYYFFFLGGVLYTKGYYTRGYKRGGYKFYAVGSVFHYFVQFVPFVQFVQPMCN